MTYIKKFERYSYPDSMSEINDWVDDFVVGKFRWWINRKSLANYKEDFVIYADEMGFDMPDDFPMEKLKISLSFTTRSDSNWGGSGYAFDFKRRGNVDVDCVMSEYRYGKLTSSMGVIIFTKKDVIEVEDIIQIAKSAIRHELLHLYEFFQIKKFGGKIPDVGEFSSAIIELDSEPDLLSQQLSKFLNVCYFITSKIEMTASLSEYTIEEIPFVDRGIRSEEEVAKILSTNKHDYINDIKSSISNEHKEKLYNMFMKKYKDSWNYKQRDKGLMRCKDFDGIIDLLYDKMIVNLPKWRKKIGKILAQQSQSSRNR